MKFSSKTYNFLLLLMVVLLCFTNVGAQVESESNDPKETVWLESIAFNHNFKDEVGKKIDSKPDCVDAIDICMDSENDVKIPEWKIDRAKQFPAAFVINKKITIFATFSTNSNINKILIKAIEPKPKKDKKEKNIQKLGNLKNVEVTFKNGKARAIFIASNVPDSVSVFTQKWKWKWKKISEADTAWKTIKVSKIESDKVKEKEKISQNRVYTILAKPVHRPWNMGKPWARALEHACTWAKGSKNKWQVAKKITIVLNLDLGCIYNYDSSYVTSGLRVHPFKKKKFLNNIQSDFGIGEIDCYGLARALEYFSNIIGCPLTYTPENEFSTYLHCIRLIGTGSDNCCESFENHSYCLLDRMVYDATLQIMDQPIIGQYNKKEYKRNLILTGRGQKKNKIKKNKKILPSKFYPKIIDDDCLLPIFQYFYEKGEKYWGSRYIKGLNIDETFFEKTIIELYNCKFYENYMIEKNPDNSYTAIIKKVWGDWKAGDILDIKMCVHQKASNAASQFINQTFQYQNYLLNKSRSFTQRKTATNENEYFSSKFDNVQIAVKFMGNFKKQYSEIVKLLLTKLKLHQENAVNDYQKLLVLEKLGITGIKIGPVLGERKILIKIEFKKQQNNDHIRFWRAYRGKVMKEDNNYYYYPQKGEKNMIKAFVVSRCGIISESSPKQVSLK